MDPTTSIVKTETTTTEDETSPSQLQAPIRFNSDELRVIRQCNKESFYQRSLPMSTILGIGTYYAVKTGYLKNNPRYGSTPKVIVAATVGYLIGKFSYQSKCAEKLMQLPNSPVGEMLRQRRRPAGDQEILEAQSSSQSIESTDSSSASQIVNIDPLIGDGFDTCRSLNIPTSAGVNIIKIPNHSTNYEELRRKNREEYEHKRPKPLPPEGTIASSAGNDSSHAQKNARNKYGDVWSE